MLEKYVYRSTGKAVAGQPFKPGQLIPTNNPSDIESILYLDASCLRDFNGCKEYFRRRWVENIVPRRAAIDKEFGIATHRAVELFWKGATYDIAYADASTYFGNLDLTNSTVKDREKYERLSDALPELIGVYYDYHGEAEEQAMVEYEWSYKYEDSVTLCGRVDRYSLDFILYDVKTASEIGKNWKTDYREAALRDIGVSLYDWYIRTTQPDSAPKNVVLEVLVKPYRDKPARYEPIALPEIVTDSYRRRFDQQLEFRVKELVHYWRNYQAVKPWPMNDGSQCVSKYGQCDYLLLCNHGSSKRNLEKYKQREEHLSIRQ